MKYQWNWTTTTQNNLIEFLRQNFLPDFFWYTKNSGGYYQLSYVEKGFMEVFGVGNFENLVAAKLINCI